MADELKPCPFCGGDAELDTSQHFRAFRDGEVLYQVAAYCTSCSASISHYPDDLGLTRDHTTDIVVTAWNTRTPIDNGAIEEAAARRALDDAAETVSNSFFGYNDSYPAIAQAIRAIDPAQFRSDRNGRG